MVGHISTEANYVPDALSRLHDPEPARLPSKVLANARQVLCPSVQGLWCLRDGP